jgi:hypothetical protein
VARFLSDEWIDEMDRAAGSASGPRAPAGALVIQHVVTDLPLEVAEALAIGDHERAYHLVVTPTTAKVAPGRCAEATVTFTATYATAASIASGARSAQAAFMAGELRLGGAVDQLLVHHGPLGTTDDVFAQLRASTEY